MDKEHLLQTIEDLDVARANPEIVDIIQQFRKGAVSGKEQKTLAGRIVDYFRERLEWNLSYYVTKKYYNRETLNEIQKDIKTFCNRYFSEKDYLTHLIEIRPLGLVEYERGKFVDTGDQIFIRLKRLLGLDSDIVIKYAWKANKGITVTTKTYWRTANA